MRTGINVEFPGQPSGSLPRYFPARHDEEVIEEKESMKLYSSFLTRCWVLRGPSGEPRFIFEAEHIQSGERRKDENLEEIRNWMLTVLKAQENSQGINQETNPDEESNERKRNQ